jgi:hypothetical protein
MFVLLLVLLAAVGTFLIDRGYPNLALAWFGISIAIGLSVYYIPTLHFRNEIRKSSVMHGERTVTISQNGLVSTFAIGNSELQWSSFTKAKETDSLFLLFVSSTSYWPVPKRAFTDVQLGEFRSLLSKVVN